MTYNIYLDVFFLLNLTMNLVVLLAGGFIVKARVEWKRMILAAALGSTAACFLLFAPITMPGSRLFVTVLMNLVSFERQDWRHFGMCVMNTYFISFAIEGTIGFTGSMYSVLFVFFLCFLWGRERRNKHQYMSVILSFHGKTKALKGFYDTGNNLLEPVTGRLVHVTSYEAVRDILPKDYQEVVEYYFATGIFEDTKVTKMQMYEFTFLSYHSIGKETGQLLGIRMDSVTFLSSAGKKTEEKAVIALTNQKIHLKNHCQIIMNGRLEL